jgi:hypothetical protein
LDTFGCNSERFEHNFSKFELHSTQQTNKHNRIFSNQLDPHFPVHFSRFCPKKTSTLLTRKCGRDYIVFTELAPSPVQLYNPVRVGGLQPFSVPPHQPCNLIFCRKGGCRESLQKSEIRLFLSDIPTFRRK